VTSSVIKPTAFRVVEQQLNHLATAVTYLSMYKSIFSTNPHRHTQG